MNLSELEALAKAAPQFGINFSAGVETPIYESVRVPPQTILQMIALIRQLGDALKEAETAMVDHGTSYLNHEDEYATGAGFAHVALNALKEFK